MIYSCIMGYNPMRDTVDYLLKIYTFECRKPKQTIKTLIRHEAVNVHSFAAFSILQQLQLWKGG